MDSKPLNRFALTKWNYQSWHRLSILLVFVLCVTYLLVQVNNQAYNLVFSDQIDLFMGYLQKEGLASLFLQQHGPHRQGVGALVMLPVLEFANWDVRSLSYLTVLIMALGAAFIILAMLKKSIHLIPSVALIILSLSFGSAELITVTPNISHSALPVFFASLLFWLLLRDRMDGAWLNITILLVVTLSLFTGFGIFLFFSYVLVFSVQVIGERLQKENKDQTKIIIILSTYALCAISLAVFFSNYDIPRANPEGCLVAPLSNLGDVLRFSFAVASIPLGGAKLGALAVPVGFIVMCLFSAIGLFALNKLFRHGDRTSFAVLVLILASGAFVINAAIGRHCLGIDSAYTSRYYQLATLGVIGSLFALDIWFRDKFSVVIKVVSVFIIGITLLSVNPSMKDVSRHFYGHKNNFALCLDGGGSVYDCNARFTIYPPDSGRLDYLLSMINNVKSE